MRLSNEAMVETLKEEEGESDWRRVKEECKLWQEKEWLAVIDRGNSTGGPSGRTSFLSPLSSLH